MIAAWALIALFVLVIAWGSRLGRGLRLTWLRDNYIAEWQARQLAIRAERFGLEATRPNLRREVGR